MKHPQVNLHQIIHRLKMAGTNEETRSILNELINTPLIAPITDLPIFSTIVRTRPVESFDMVQTTNDLSYQRNKLKISLGRANKAEEAMFYGTYSLHSPRAQIGSCMETMPCYRESSPSEGDYYSVSGYWQLIKKMSFYSFLNPYPQKNRAKWFLDMAEKFEEYAICVRDRLGYSLDEIYAFYDFMHSAFTNDSADNDAYYLTANMTSDLIMSPEIDGVIYQSVKSVDEKLRNVLCVAIKPSSVDKKMKMTNALASTVTLGKERMGKMKRTRYDDHILDLK